jgi:hypothetical protein
MRPHNCPDSLWFKIAAYRDSQRRTMFLSFQKFIQSQRRWRRRLRFVKRSNFFSSATLRVPQIVIPGPTSCDALTGVPKLYPVTYDKCDGTRGEALYLRCVGNAIFFSPVTLRVRRKILYYVKGNFSVSARVPTNRIFSPVSSDRLYAHSIRSMANPAMPKSRRKRKYPAGESDSELSLVLPNPLLKTQKYLITVAEAGSSSITTTVHTTSTLQRKPQPLTIDAAPALVDENKTAPVHETRVRLTNSRLISEADENQSATVL